MCMCIWMQKGGWDTHALPSSCHPISQWLILSDAESIKEQSCLSASIRASNQTRLCGSAPNISPADHTRQQWLTSSLTTALHHILQPPSWRKLTSLVLLAKKKKIIVHHLGSLKNVAVCDQGAVGTLKQLAIFSRKGPSAEGFIGSWWDSQAQDWSFAEATRASAEDCSAQKNVLS